VLDIIKKSIMNDPENIGYTNRSIEPLYAAHPDAKICLVGQAPGIKAETSKLYWNDPSGDRLREWMGISREQFYSDKRIAVLPMDFYFPGKGKSGDLPPRTGFAQIWHPPLLEMMPDIELFVLIGAYAQAHYIKPAKYKNCTQIVENYRDFLPRYFPIVHPSPRNNIWLKKNEWFESDVVPELRKLLQEILL